MKNHVLFSVILTLCILGCKNKSDDRGFPDVYQLTEALEFVPLEKFQTHASVVFENSTGEQLSFYIRYEESEDERPIEETFYNTETIEISLQSDAVDYAFSIRLSSGGTSGEIRDWIHVSFLRPNGGSFIYLSPSLMDIPGAETGLVASLELNGTVYENVYVDASGFENNEFLTKRLFYTVEQGVIGYYDTEDVLWTLKEYR